MVPRAPLDCVPRRFVELITDADRTLIDDEFTDTLLPIAKGLVGPPLGVKFADTVLFSVIDTTHDPVPEHAPVQPEKV